MTDGFGMELREEGWSSQVKKLIGFLKGIPG